jgi:cytochrome P450
MARRRYPPGPNHYLPWRLLGLRRVYRLACEPLDFVTDLARTYGDIVYYRLLSKQAFQVNHPDLIREVLVTKSASFPKQPRQMNIIRQISGDGLLTSEGDLWLRQRRIMMPAFQSREATRMVQIAVEQAARLVNRWQPGQSIRVNAEMNACMVRAISQSLFDVDSDSDAARLGDAMADISKGILDQIGSLATLPAWFPGSSRGHQQRAQRMIEEHIDAAIVRRRANPSARGDLLDLLLTAVDHEEGGRHMSDVQARCEAVTMLFAGHHTAAANLTWTLYLLAKNPGVRERLLEEIDDALDGRTPTPADLPKLRYTEQVIKESMRIYPPAWALFARQASGDVEIGGYTIPRGGWVFIYPWVVHRDARFYPDPERFDPDRFAPCRAESIPTGAFIPFGLGGHTCIGNRVAMTLLTLVLPTILQRHTLRLAPGGIAPVPEPLVSIRPKGDLPMIVEQRKVARS